MTPKIRETSVSSTMISELSSVVGDSYVLWKAEDLLVYEYDGSIDKASPQAVVLPSTAEEVEAVVKIANKHGAYIVARGAGTSLSGGAVPLRNSVVIALTRLTKLIEVDAENRVAIVEPGMINLHLSQKSAISDFSTPLILPVKKPALSAETSVKTPVDLTVLHSV